jgi:hypothetical protein
VQQLYLLDCEIINSQIQAQVKRSLVTAFIVDFNYCYGCCAGLYEKLQVEPWFYAKVILFLYLVSMIKMYKKDDTVLLVQRRAGLLIGTVALVGILGLVMIKPVFA